MQRHSSIGVFDSGLGGLSVLAALRELLPWEDFIYAADSAYTPYGDRSEDFIMARSRAVGDFLYRQNVKALVIACNTATAVAATALRDHYTVPMIAIEPALKP